ncbi:hypothetical protein [Cellulomonas chengniuliangii]|uniref:hypothetical protein n=1 Tax=Cellulomonas chengniuliangii TaxID=2968084 RepID=UPI001D0EA27E|nr:hypothetical protein [Cellulomonas chengniuliangii]MCC2316927.1 hypothetical protein [Cellulomonas chengniuliangii]
MSTERAPAPWPSTRVDSAPGGRGRSTPHRPRDGVVAVVLGAVLAIVGWLRLSPTARDTLWAEDGRVFLWDAFYSQPWSVLLRSHDGYLHLLPRVAAEVTVLVSPPGSYATVMSAAGCVLAGSAAALVFVCAGSVTSSTAIRVSLAAVTLLVPALPLEVLGNLANIHWFALWLTPWLLLHSPRTRTGGALLGLVALACALTEIQTALFLPLVLWRWRDRRGWAVRAGLVIGIATQLLVSSPRPPRPTPAPGADDIVTGYLVNAVMTLWWGSAEAITDTVVRFGWAPAALVLLAVCAAVVLVLRRGTPVQRLAVATFSVASVVLWSAALVLNRPEMDWSRPDPASTRELIVARYAVVPSMMLLAILILAVAVLPRRRAAYAGASVVLAPILVAAVTAFAPAQTARSSGPAWTPEVDTAREVCGGAPAPDAVELPVAPPGWTSRVPCDVLEDDG